MAVDKRHWQKVGETTTFSQLRQGFMLLGSSMVGLGLLAITAISAFAESYIAGMAGWTIPQQLQEAGSLVQKSASLFSLARESMGLDAQGAG